MRELERLLGRKTLEAPPLRRVEAHVKTANRLHSDDTTVPAPAPGRTSTGRCWVYVRDDRPFSGGAAPAAMFHYSRYRSGTRPQAQLATAIALRVAGLSVRI